jgi:hypothetical protein
MKLLTFPDHPELDGRHAPFPASSPSWLNYDEDRLKIKFQNDARKELGTELHAFAASSIKLMDKLTKNKYEVIRCFKSYLKGKYDKGEDSDISEEEKNRSYKHLLNLYQAMDFLPDRVWLTLVLYINDACSYHMTPERHLFYSWNFFGTADAIGYDVTDHILRIHDLKTGDTPAKFEQLYIYAALACLEHKLNVDNISIELRIYQNGNRIDEKADITKVKQIIDIIKRDDRIWKDMTVGGR